MNSEKITGLFAWENGQNMRFDVVRYFGFFELALYVLSYPFLVSFTIVIARKRIFHPNLVVLLINTAASLLIALMSRTTMLLMEVFTKTFATSTVYCWASKISDLGMYAMAFNISSLVIERVAASAMSRFYEKFCAHIPYLGFLLCIIQWSLCWAIIYIYHEGYINALVLLTVVFFLYLIALLIFCLLPVVAKSAYHRGLNRLYAGGGHSLTERYQLSENLRCAHMLNRVIFVISATAFFAVGIVGLTYLPLNRTTSRLLIRIYYFTPPAQTILITVVIFQASQKLHSEFIRLFCCRQANVGRIVQPAIANKPNEYRMTAEEERRIYFENYNKSWK